MDFQKESTRKRAEEFRTRLVILQQLSDLTETETAAKAGMEQQTYSQYLIPNSGKNLPAFFIPFLPEPIRDGILEYLSSQSNGAFSKTLPLMTGLNGILDDEFLSATGKLGTAIEKYKTDPEYRSNPAKKEALKRLLRGVIQDSEKAIIELEALL